MKLVMTMVVRDEAPLVGANVAYHLSRGVDHVIATDHRSTDGTDRILRDLEREGALSYFREDGEAFAQDAWATRMARMAVEEHRADWVFHVDADEFWWPEQTDSLKATLANVPDDILVLQAPRSNFVAVDADTSELPFHQLMRHRQRVSLNPLGKPLPGKIIHRGIEGIEVGFGYHVASIDGRRAIAPAFDDALVMHFPMRSVERYRQKIRDGVDALVRNTRLERGVAITWREQMRMEQQGELEAHLRRQLHDHQGLADGVASNELIEDSRFADYMASMQAS
ncbi:MAG: glycosyltransferase family 2 protein [Lysobacteraceae bacterium]